MNDDDLRASVADVPVPVFEDRAFMSAPPLAEARVEFVTTAGLHLRDQPRWSPGEEVFRPLPASTDGLVLS